MLRIPRLLSCFKQDALLCSCLKRYPWTQTGNTKISHCSMIKRENWHGMSYTTSSSVWYTLRGVGGLQWALAPSYCGTDSEFGVQNTSGNFGWKDGNELKFLGCLFCFSFVCLFFFFLHWLVLVGVFLSLLYLWYTLVILYKRIWFCSTR